MSSFLLSPKQYLYSITWFVILGLIVFTLYTNSTDSLVSVLRGIWEKLGLNKHELTGVHDDSEGHLNGFSGNIFSEAFAYSEEGFSDAYSKFSQAVTHDE